MPVGRTAVWSVLPLPPGSCCGLPLPPGVGVDRMDPVAAGLTLGNEQGLSVSTWMDRWFCGQPDLPVLGGIHAGRGPRRHRWSRSWCRLPGGVHGPVRDGTVWRHPQVGNTRCPRCASAVDGSRVSDVSGAVGIPLAPARSQPSGRPGAHSGGELNRRIRDQLCRRCRERLPQPGDPRQQPADPGMCHWCDDRGHVVRDGLVDAVASTYRRGRDRRNRPDSEQPGSSQVEAGRPPEEHSQSRFALS